LFISFAILGIFSYLNRKSQLLPDPTYGLTKKSSELERLLVDSKIEIKSGPFLDRDNKSFSVITHDDIKVLFSSERDLQTQIFSLQLILNEIYNDLEDRYNNPKVIDLRSKNPNVTF